MSNDKKVTLTSSEIFSDIKKDEEKIHNLEDKAEKLAELLGSTVKFDEWNLKEAKSNIKVEKIDIENVSKIQEPIIKTNLDDLVDAKKTEETIIEEPIVEEPVVEEPKVEEPIVEEPVVEEPKVEEPIVEEPKVEEPIVEEPVVEEPIVEEPKVEEVKVEETTSVVEEKPEEVIPAKKQEVKKENKAQVKKEFKKVNNKPKTNNNVSFTGYFEKVVGVKKISKTTKGGRHMRFSALVIIGDKNGTVGYGKGKSIEVPVAIRKALKDAKNNLRKVKINKDGTLYHEVIGKQGAGKVLIKPAPTGTGIIAGGPIRVVLELAGYKDVYSKNLGKNTSINMVLATLNGLDKIRSPKEIAFLRDKNLKDL